MRKYYSVTLTVQQKVTYVVPVETEDAIGEIPKLDQQEKAAVAAKARFNTGMQPEKQTREKIVNLARPVDVSKRYS